MSDYGRISKSIVKAIADALRFCNGNEAQYTPGQMPNAVRLLKKRLTQKMITQNGTYIPPSNYDGFDRVTVNVEGGGDAVLVSKNITANGNYSPVDDNADGYSSVSVAVPGPSLQSKTATQNGQVTPDTGYDGLSSVEVAVPNTYSAADNGKVVSGGQLVAQTARAAAITQNGTYDTTVNNSVTVNVSGGGSGGAVVQPLSVIQNGTYNPPSGVDGYAPVTVNVSGSGDDPFALTNYIESSGTQWIDTGYVPKQNSSYEFVTEFLSRNPQYSMIIGARDTAEGTSGNPVLFGPGNSSFQIGWGTRTLTTGISSTPFVGLKGVYRFDKDGYDASTETKRPSGYGTYSGNAPLTTNTLYIFSLNAAGSEYGTTTRCKAKLYRFRILESGVLVHEFIPWQENGVACLKDTVTSEIKYNAGTGDFVYGTDA